MHIVKSYFQSSKVQVEGNREVMRQDERFNLDVVISVGYRVKTQRGVEFCRWATDVLRRYIIDCHAENEKRLAQLGQVARIMARIPDDLETRAMPLEAFSAISRDVASCSR